MMDTSKNSPKGNRLLNLTGIILSVTICLLFSLCIKGEMATDTASPHLERHDLPLPSEQDTFQRAGILLHKS